VTGTGLDHLRCEESLQSIDLRGSPISDSGIQSILRFHNLKRLNVDQATASDHSLSELKHLPLRELTLPDTTAAATVDALRAAMPNCKINR
jgi:hypothetical protein